MFRFKYRVFYWGQYIPLDTQNHSTFKIKLNILEYILIYISNQFKINLFTFFKLFFVVFVTFEIKLNVSECI